MAAHYESKHGSVALPPEQLYMGFTDMRNLTNNIPEQYRDSVTADFDNLSASVRGFSIDVHVAERRPYSLIRLEDSEAPFHFSVQLHFDPDPEGTDFSIEVDADLNLMMKAMLGGKITDALNKLIDGLVTVSHGGKPDIPTDLGK